MKRLALAGIFLFSSAASASYLESCKFIAVVTEVMNVATLNDTVQEYTDLVKIDITAASDLGSHFSEVCTDKTGEEVTLLVKKGEKYEIGDLLTINYFYANSPGPDMNFYMTETWKIEQKHTVLPIK